MAETICVEVAYADSTRQIVRKVEIAPNSTVDDAIAASGILAELPGFEPAAVGVFGHRVARDARLRAGDRVELYRPLRVDPKEARRLRASKRNQP